MATQCELILKDLKKGKKIKIKMVKNNLLSII